MVTDGGGWTVLWATSGGDDELPFAEGTNYTNAGTDPLNNEQYNLGRTTKAAVVAQLAAASTSGHADTLLRRSSSEWLVVDHEPLDAAAFGAATAGTATWPVALRAASGSGGDVVSGRGWMGYSSDGVSGGGDFAVSLGTGNAGAGITQFGQAATARLVGAGCSGQLVYSLSTAVADGDGAYGSEAMLGNWGPIGACSGAEADGSAMAFLVAVRESSDCTSKLQMIAEVNQDRHSPYTCLLNTLPTPTHSASPVMCRGAGCGL